MGKDKKIRGIRSQLIEFDGEYATFKLFDELDVAEAQKIAKNGKYYAYVDFVDERDISDAQRNYYWALMGDYSDYTGYPKRSAGDLFYIDFMNGENLDEMPSVAKGRMEMSLARELIQYVLEHFIQNDIPFKNREFNLADDVNKLLYAMTMKRMCWICGKQENTEVHHATDLVGMGYDRNKYNHLKSTFMCLCVSGNDSEDETKMMSHHQEVHNLGLTKFMEKYHVAPIKLDKYSLNELGIRGKY